MDGQECPSYGERDGDAIAKHRAAAITAARDAYQKAWCQGPPYAYAFGLANSKAHLDALGQPYPDMPPYDDSKYEPMPDVTSSHRKNRLNELLSD